MKTAAAVVVVALVLGVLPSRGRAQPAASGETPAPMVEHYLTTGRLADGEAAHSQHLQANPGDDQARFGLGVLQAVRAVEHLIQNLHAYGMRGQAGSIPYLRLPVPPNEHPKPLTYKAAGRMLRQWNDELAKAQKTLEGVKASDVRLPIRPGLVRLDFDGDGNATENETLWKVYASTARQSGVTADRAREFLINFDAGDGAWLRGYCHLLMAMNEIVLAYDEKELFDATAQFFFKDPQTPYPFLKRGGKESMWEDIADAVAFIHLLRCPVNDPAHMRAALDHLETMLRLSRESWKSILAETDDDHEWIPSPRQQHPAIGNWTVTQAMVDHWMKFLDESQALLAGKKLAPFWRGNGDKGVNLRKIFTDPRPLDAVLWVQGSAAAPYLEEGQITDSKTWRDIWTAFGQESFFGFAIWFN
jgi:hypothetical protein